ncbi:unnamed protein product [Closterium sp. NIES-54]
MLLLPRQLWLLVILLRQHSSFMCWPSGAAAAVAATAADDAAAAAQQMLHVLAKVERREYERESRAMVIQLRLFLPPTASPRLARCKQLMGDRSCWHVTRILSLVPHMREFQALAAAQYLPLLPPLLKPSCFTAATAGAAASAGAAAGAGAAASAAAGAAASAAGGASAAAGGGTESLAATASLEGTPLPLSLRHKYEAQFNRHQLQAIRQAVGGNKDGIGSTCNDSAFSSAAAGRSAAAAAAASAGSGADGGGGGSSEANRQLPY